MKIAAFSDIHGCLNDVNITSDGIELSSVNESKMPSIEEGTDVICIAGDIIPLKFQRDNEYSYCWFRDVFIPWAKEVNVKKILFVAGNHDFFLERKPSKVLELVRENGLEDKLIYLFDSEYEFEGKKFYGCPWCKGPYGWAFSPRDKFMDTESKYDFIPESCDVVITHQPPMVDSVGCSNPHTPTESEFGSFKLREVIELKKPKINICGHIHTGIHGGIKFVDTTIYNVSLLNEYYAESYPVTYIEI